MKRDEWQRVKGLAADALARAADERHAYIRDRCAGDERIRREVESLLTATAAAEGLYEEPAFTVAPGDTIFREAFGPVTPPPAGSRIGPYRLVREIDRGGMGTVYLAERAEDEFEQQVAIKFVSATLAGESLLRRFREERRILASLEHPNIARLLDGGTTSDGFPYVVMEYIDGVSIMEFCARDALTVEQRIALFRVVAAAVHYAHQRLVIHRDIKDSNILVLRDGTPKLLDFGIATLLDPDGPAAVRSPTLLRALTPDSASPEQVRGERVTIAADVYGLGVLLYRLLTGCGPYASAPSSDTALMRAICDEDPLPPSAVARRAERAPAGRVGRDLDLIALKALRKEPDRRYSSAEQFSADLGRYLEGRPVLAAPDTRRYRTSKFLRRHRAVVASTAAALAAVLAGAGLAVNEARIATHERMRADRRFEDVRRMANSFLFEFHDAIADVPGTLAARQLVVKRAAEYLDGLTRESGGDVALQRELATAYQRLGEILGGGGVANLGDHRGAEAQYARALAIREALAARRNADPLDLEALAALRVLLSRYNLVTGHYEEGEKSAREAVTLLQSGGLAGRDGHAGRLASALHQLGFAQTARGKNAAALASLNLAMTAAHADADTHPRNRDAVARLARIEIDCASQLLEASRASDAMTLLSNAHRRLDDVLAGDASNRRYREYLQMALNYEAGARSALGDKSGALRALTAAVQTAETSLKQAPGDQGLQFAAMMSHSTLAAGMLQAGDRAGGVRRLRQAIAEGRAILTVSPQNGYAANQLAAVVLDLGETLLSANRRSIEGCRQIAEGLAMTDGLAARHQLMPDMTKIRRRYEALRAQCGR